ncbi:peptide-methionine (S)-S-oxide reductase [Paraburkholderia sp. GAS41]|jgi:peptide-methionine (S)-S-oxide reductase|uniref:peptide-methionine (S)-S-oxide reductase MsrA n=1 Tax=Paraburkholderia sp. GAS41 TaxID=3035134 RepID=UPI003D230D75
MSERNQVTLGAGCFWGAEAALRQLPGVLDTRVGFASGGQPDAPKVEVVQVDFDAAVLPLTTVIEHFWTLHDPTSVDRQGTDMGAKYRSAIFVNSDQQAQEANAAKRALSESGRLSKPVVTEVTVLEHFELAREEDQRYVEKHGGSACSL